MGISRKTLEARLDQLGWGVDQALSLPSLPPQAAALRANAVRLAKLSPGQRSEIGRKLAAARNAKLSPKQRSEAARRSAATRRRALAASPDVSPGVGTEPQTSRSPAVDQPSPLVERALGP